MIANYSLNWQSYNQKRKDRGDTRPSALDILEELAARRLARESFINFAQYTFDNYQPDPFHEKLGEIFDQVVSGELQFVIINAPPQHGKSVHASEILPAYWLGRRPNDPVVIASYNADLARSKSREARKLVDSEAFRNLFGNHATRDDPDVAISDTSAAVDDWRLMAPYRGGMRSAGVGGGLTGHPAKLAIIDDPLKDIKEAQSETVRESVWAWYRTVLRTRVNEGGAIVIILTRWHPEDLAGKLLKQSGLENADKFKVFRFPALAETQETRDANNKFLGLPLGEPDPLGRLPGEPLAPKRFGKQSLEAIRETIGSQYWGALYDGVPRSREGNWFKSTWFQTVPAVPRYGRRIRYWDKAASEDKGGPATASVLMLKTPDGHYYIEDVIQVWLLPGAREELILKTAREDERRYGSKHAVEIFVEQEPGSGGKESADATINTLSRNGYSCKRDLPTGDKDVRLEPFAAQAEMMKVFMLVAEWNEVYLDEMTSIPHSVRRDQGDATSGAFNNLAQGAQGSTQLPVTGLYGRNKKRR